MYCPKCGSQVPSTKNFCTSCGAPLSDSVTQAAAPPVPSPAQVPGTGSDPVQTKPSFLDKWYDPQSPNTKQTQAASKMTYNILWFALFMSLHTYVLVSYLVGKGRSGDTHPPFLMLPALAVVGLSCLGFGITIIKLQITPDKIRKYQEAQHAMQHIQTYGIIGMAQIEAVCIFGLALFFVGFPAYIFYAFYAVSVIAMVLSRVIVEPAWKFVDSNPAWKMDN